MGKQGAHYIPLINFCVVGCMTPFQKIVHLIHFYEKVAPK